MDIQQYSFTAKYGWQPALPSEDTSVQLILGFGSKHYLFEQNEYQTLKNAFPSASLVGCTTAGEILSTAVRDNSISITAIKFDKAEFDIAIEPITELNQSEPIAASIAKKLSEKDKLRHVLVFTDGLMINGSALSKGFNEHLPEGISVTGGLAGDGSHFDSTSVWHNGHVDHQVVAIGLYGDSLTIGHGSLGGWSSFGPKRTITRAEDNVLYELDNQSALELYKNFLGDQAEQLPAAALFFPLKLQNEDNPQGVVRTILAINQKEQSMTFAGDVPEKSTVQLMRANFDRLIDGAYEAAENAQLNTGVDLALLVSCVGRKLVLEQRVEEEVESVREVLGNHAAITGFYSYGELCPSQNEVNCTLHNQTMTITTIKEA